MHHRTTPQVEYTSFMNNEVIYTKLYPFTHPHIGVSIHDNCIECIRLASRIMRPIADHEPDWEYRVVVRYHNSFAWLQKTLILPTSSHITLFLLKYASMIESALSDYGYIPSTELYEKFGIITPEFPAASQRYQCQSAF